MTNSTKKFLEIINNVSKVFRMHNQLINISSLFIYKQQMMEEENIDKFPFPVSRKIIEHLGINLVKDRNNLYNENSNCLKKDIQEDTRNWKIIPYS